MAASAWGACRWFGVATTTASTPGSVASDSQSVVTCSMPCFAAKACAVSRPVVRDADDPAEAGVLHGADVEIGDEAAAEDGDPQVGHGRKSRAAIAAGRD